MSCTICTKTKPIPQCSGALFVGVVDTELEEVFVLINEPITGRNRWINADVEDGGILEIDLFPLAEFLSPELTYNIQAFETMADINNPLPITIGATEYTCLNINVITVADLDGAIEGPIEITLEIDA